MDANFSPNCVVVVKVLFVNPKENNEAKKDDNHHVRCLETIEQHKRPNSEHNLESDFKRVVFCFHNFIKCELVMLECLSLVGEVADLFALPQSIRNVNNYNQELDQNECSRLLIYYV